MQTPASVTEIYVYAGSTFGRACARYLRAFGIRFAEFELPGSAELSSGAWVDKTVVLFGPRPIDSIVDQMDGTPRIRGQVLIPAVLYANYLEVGPVIINGTNPCWRCWTSRVRQHAVPEDYLVERTLFYEDPRNKEPRGFLASTAAFAAARVSLILSDLSCNVLPPGAIWSFDLAKRGVSESTVVGVHACTRCGSDPSGNERGYAKLRDELSYLWKMNPDRFLEGRS